MMQLVKTYGLWFYIVFWLLAGCTGLSIDPSPIEYLAGQIDFTDTGVGCVDDCLDPMED